MAETVAAFELGVRDAIEQGGKLERGRTWRNRASNEAYDRGANVGEALASTAAALDLLATGAGFNYVVERTGCTARVSGAIAQAKGPS